MLRPRQPIRQLCASAARGNWRSSYARNQNSWKGLRRLLARAVVIAANENFLIDRLPLFHGASHRWLRWRRALKRRYFSSQFNQLLASLGRKNLLFLVFRN